MMNAHRQRETGMKEGLSHWPHGLFDIPTPIILPRILFPASQRVKSEIGSLTGEVTFWYTKAEDTSTKNDFYQREVHNGEVSSHWH
jgi:hypothetical protein